MSKLNKNVWLNPAVPQPDPLLRTHPHSPPIGLRPLASTFDPAGFRLWLFEPRHFAAPKMVSVLVGVTGTHIIYVILNTFNL